MSTEEWIWDNSNIAESYSGIVLPLTCSFAQIIYKQVYVDVAKTSGVSSKKIAKHEHIFSNLLGFHYGRFYYNILNWYRMLTLFPGYHKNKKNLDHMISAKSKADLSKSAQTNVSALFSIYYYTRLLFRYITFERALQKFKTHVSTYLAAQPQDLSSKTPKELLSLYHGFKQELLSKWSITVDNDFLAMSFYGKLEAKCKKTNQSILDLISNEQQVISARQVDSLHELGSLFLSYPALIGLADNNKHEQCLQEIQTNPQYQQLNKKIEHYLTIYGGRFANELRLEAADLDDDPTYLINLLRLYASTPKKETPPQKTMQNTYLIKKTKHYLKNREELRLLRSHAFSHTRRIFKTLGEKFFAQKIIDHASDIFYLHIPEIETYLLHDDTISLKELIAKRKKDYESYQTKELPSVFTTTTLTSPPILSNQSSQAAQTLKGIGCSPGIISGKVTVLKQFRLPKDQFEIVVTKHTDPGWTPLFGLCKGIIVEHGGLLSHAAIVSREIGLPCVIGANNATTLLKDGDQITINGESGEITKHDS